MRTKGAKFAEVGGYISEPRRPLGSDGGDRSRLTLLLLVNLQGLRVRRLVLPSGSSPVPEQSEDCSCSILSPELEVTVISRTVYGIRRRAPAGPSVVHGDLLRNGYSPPTVLRSPCFYLDPFMCV